MAISIDTRTGPVTNNDGPGDQPLRQDRTAALVVTDAHARYGESVVRGNVFTVCSTGITTLQGFATPLTTGGTPLLALYNPANSGKAAVIIRGGAIPVSLGASAAVGPLGTGFSWNYYPNAALTVAETASPLSNTLTSTSRGNTVMKGYGITALALSTTAVHLRAINGAVITGTSTATVQVTAAAFPGLEEVAGDIVVPPNTVLVIMPNTTSTVATALASITYEEVNYP